VRRLFAALPRLLPRSMAGQLTILLLVALLLSQLVTTGLLVYERRTALVESARQAVLRDAVAVARLIERTPDSLHEGLLLAAATGDTVFSISQQSELADAAAGTPAAQPPRRDVLDLLGARARPVRPPVAARMIGGPGDQAEDGIRVFEATRPGLGWLPPPARPDPDPRSDTELAAAAANLALPVSLAASVELNDGRWLNVASTFGTDLPPLWPTFLSSGLMALAIIAIIVFSVRRITRPLRALAAASEKLGHGESVPRLPLTGPREVQRATSAFNAMQERLTRFLRDRTAMLAAISHDLRTPLTSLRLRAEFVDDDEMREKLVETIAEMQHMAEATLSFAREDATEEETRVVDLAGLAQSVADDLADLGNPVSFAESARLPYACRPISLKRALRNLAENAIRYGRRARIAVIDGREGPTIVVEDEGSGIPPERMEDVFEPFVRLETSRSEQTGGVGLGLSIARSIARAQGGDIVLENRPEGGLRASIRMPKKAVALAAE